ncbi:MAG: trehalose-phosphatase [Gemmatimonadaceae bacterium]|nr:trehalose-phosphatase [Gemmatimonadaceae bacterium]
MTRNILAARNVERLRSIAERGALLAFDFDGTLAPMSTDPDANRMREESIELLRNLAHAAPVAVVTGRSVRDMAPRVEGVPLLAVIGNHGAEPSPYARRAVREVRAWMPQLVQVVASLPGVVLEDKGMSVSVHHWHSPDPHAAIAAIEALVPALPKPARVIHGIGIVNLVPEGAPDKGDAVATLMAAHGLPAALFVGDELTDEPAFRFTAASPNLGVRVGRWRESAATFHIPSQADIDALLTELLIGCTRPRRPRTAPGSAPADASTQPPA